ncbi:MAG: hypothetical protein R3C53_27800 [Pirellulaceae bacterium]
MNYVVIAQSEASGEAMAHGWCRLLGLPNLEGMVGKAIVFDQELHFAGHVNRIFDYLCGRIEDRLESLPAVQSSDVTVLVDAIEADDLSLAKEDTNWTSLVAMLIATYPELNWVFAFSGRGACNDDFPEASHDRYSIFGVERNALFDPTGLRDWIRIRTNGDLVEMAKRAVADEDEAFQLPLRKQTAAVIEDENDYAMIHGYAAYRFGFRTDVVTTWGQMKELFRFTPKGEAYNPAQPPKVPDNKRHIYSLILEDMRVQFPDKPANVHLSRPNDRARECNLLADENDQSEFRFCISTGQESSADDLWNEYDGYLYHKRHGIGKLLPKPIGGPLEIWKATGLRIQLENGLSEGFVSPPAVINGERYDGHGSPGKLALVAQKLIDRARYTAINATSTSDFIMSAVMANDAFELLGGKTPTMSLEAIKIKHVAEVRAECTFVGAGFHFDLNDRFAEIYEFVHSTCRWYHQSVRKYAELDARATICNELVKVYSEAGQAEERDACLAEFRWNNRRLELLQALEKRKPVSVGANCVLLYAELLLVSMTRIVAAFVLWIAFFWLVTHFAVDQTNDQGFAVLLATQLDWMVGGGASGIAELSKATEVDDRRLAWISIAANVTGVFHFGILMSFLYSLISRK